MRLESLFADAVYGWRQIRKHPVTSAAAILSLALAIGACTSAFRLIDALLLRPLPITDPDRLHVVAFERAKDGKTVTWESCSYPQFRQWRAAVQDEAELIATSFGRRIDLTYAADTAMEKANLQFVSGWMFTAFGLRPAIGRVLTEADDRTPGAHPYAVLSHQYWTRRFGQDPGVLGRTFRMDGRVVEIVGVLDAGFTGTEPGTATDVFLPMTMNSAGSLQSANAFWLRTFVRPKPGVAVGPLGDKLRAMYRTFEEERQKTFATPAKARASAYDHAFLLRPASSGISSLQKDYRIALIALGGLVALVLLIACANLANLMTVRAVAREKELALRVSIGARPGRLAQLVLVESAIIAGLATIGGALLAWWSAPLIVGTIAPRDNPAWLALPLDWRMAAFGAALTCAVLLIVGLAPALRASRPAPILALKGESTRRVRRRLVPALIAVQVTFCVVVYLFGGLFVATYVRLANEPTGYAADGLLTLDTVASSAQAPAFWDQVGDRLRETPGVESVALAGWSLMSGTMSNNFISVDGAPPRDVLGYFLGVSPGWTSVMKIPFVAGRDFRADETDPGVAIVNETFARTFFGGEPPVGRTFETVNPRGPRTRFQVVGLVKDARYREMREPMLPVYYVPIHAAAADGTPRPRTRGTFLVRTSLADPLSLTPTLRQRVREARSEFRVSTVLTQTEIDRSHTMREQLLAVLATFFTVVAVLLAGVGLYGVVHAAVVQRRREIGIRLALGARAADVARRLTLDVFLMVLAGAAAGLALGTAAERYVRTLLYDVRGTDPVMLAVPAVTMLALALAASLPPVLRALRIDPLKTLR